LRKWTNFNGIDAKNIPVDIKNFTHFFEPDQVYYSEERLQSYWYQELWKQSWRTVSGQQIDLISPGLWNRTEGPDFREVRLLIGEKLFSGDIELHFDNADWYRHEHHLNPQYNQCVLHVVFRNVEDAESVIAQDGHKIPVLHIPYEALLTPPERFACRKTALSPEEQNMKLNELGWQRLERKVSYFIRQSQRFSFDLMLLWGLFKTAGIRYNQKSMIQLFIRFPWDLWLEGKIAKNELEALLFAYSQMAVSATDSFCASILEMQKKVPQQQLIRWHYARTRPVAFPDRRLAWIAAFLKRGLAEWSPNALYTRWVSGENWSSISQSFFNLPLDPYWHYRYRLGTTPADKAISQSPGASLSLEMNANVLLPLMIAIEHKKGSQKKNIQRLREEFMKLKLPQPYTATKNFLERHKLAALKIQSKNWLLNQGVLALEERYCTMDAADFCPFCGIDEQEPKNSNKG
jgi:hypothetical protein